MFEQGDNNKPIIMGFLRNDVSERTTAVQVEADNERLVLSADDCVISDTGAASGGILVSLAAFGISQEVVPWNSTVVWCSSDNGQRAAAWIVEQ